MLTTHFFLPSIPLVPRRPKSGEPGTGKGKDKKGDKKKGQAADADKPETPVAPSDPDEKVSQNTMNVNTSREVIHNGGPRWPLRMVT